MYGRLGRLQRRSAPNLGTDVASTKQQEQTPNDLTDYRKHLVSAEQKSQEDFDKTVLTLSGGALGVSLTFLKDVIGSSPVASPGLLLSSWMCWAVSASVVLISFYLSQIALRHAIAQVDNGSIHNEKPGGRFSTYTSWLNGLGAILFLVGMFTIILFVHANFAKRSSADANKTSAVTAPAKAEKAAEASSKPSSR